MKNLFDIDLKDYKETDTHFCRPSARAVIFMPDHKLAMVYSTRDRYYKFPGGGIHEDEEKTSALIREVREEVGMNVIPSSIREYGYVHRLQKSDHGPDTVFDQKNYYYFCRVEEGVEHQNLDDYEAEAGFELRIVTPKEAKETNRACLCNKNFDQIMVNREARVLELLESRLELRTLPETIEEAIRGREYEENTVGMSDSDVYMFEDRVLKIQKQNPETENEIKLLRWIEDSLDPETAALFPKILAYEVEAGMAYTLMTRVDGEMLCSRNMKQNPKLLVHLAAEGLKAMWNIDISQCPCRTSRLDERLKAARFRVENHLVDMKDAEEGTYGEDGFKNPEELLEWLENHRPQEDLVFTHGDYCLPNVMVEGGKLKGFIDLGKAGPADRWQDIALCLRSAYLNFYGYFSRGVQYTGYDPQMLLDELGIPMDEEKNRYYRLLDEL